VGEKESPFFFPHCAPFPFSSLVSATKLIIHLYKGKKKERERVGERNRG
jgi:hypothetical protein